MYDNNKQILGMDAFNSVEVTQAKIKAFSEDWISYKEENQKRKKFLETLVRTSEKDTTLFLSSKEIIDKIFALIGVSVSQDWVIENFMDALVELSIKTKDITFKEFLGKDFDNQVYTYISHKDPLILEESTPAVAYVDAKFSPLKTIEIMNELLADRLIWKGYDGGLTSD